MPDAVLRPIAYVSGALTVISMAALGLGVDLRVIGRVGPRVTTAVVVSLLVLLIVSLVLIRVLHIT